MNRSELKYGIIAAIIIFLMTWCFMAAVARADQKDIIEQAVYFEARNQSLDGQIAVGFVMLNRVEDYRFPNTIHEVITQGYKPNSRICQFSFFCDGKSDIPKNKKAYDRARVAVFIARCLKYVRHHHFPALFYKADYSNKKWGDGVVAKIGDHTFYERY